MTKIYWRVFSALFFVSLIGSNSLEAQALDKVRFKLLLDPFGIRADQLPPRLDVSGSSKEENSIDLVGSEEYFEQLRALGHSVEILERQKLVDDEYHDPDEVIRAIQGVVERYPEIATVVQLGTSFRGRPVFAVRISTENNLDTKPSILFNAMHHAREVMTPEVILDIMTYLTNNFYNPDKPEVAAWVDSMKIWLVPQVNPDGNAIVWTEDSWWRKNAHGDETWTWGVDLNRNYPYQWDSCNGSSGDKNSQTYRGESPGSEPETKGLMRLVAEEKPLINISFHSYSELVISPYGCRGEYSPEVNIVDYVGQIYADQLVTDNNRSTYRYGPAWDILYPVDGEDISWMHHDHNVLAYVVELNSRSQGFQPDYGRWRNETIQKQRPGWKFLLNYVMQGPQVRGRVHSSETHHLIDAEIKLVGAPYTTETGHKTKNGLFHKLINPGSHQLVVTAPGFEPKVVDVEVFDRPVDISVFLSPREN